MQITREVLLRNTKKKDCSWGGRGGRDTGVRMEGKVKWKMLRNAFMLAEMKQ